VGSWQCEKLRFLVDRSITMKAVRLLSSTVAALLASAAVASAGAPPPLEPVSHDDLGRAPVTIHDSVLPRHPRRLRAAQASRAPYVRAAGGELVRVSASPGLHATAATLRSYATLFASFVHSSELGSVTVYLAPYSEMRDVCGADADSCFSPSDDEIVLVGQTPPDGTPIAEIAAHEYGHHIALHRSNRPWDAGDWGPKRWATYEGVCTRFLDGTAFPGDEASHYDLNPGEAWAETNRVLNGGSDPWVRIDRSFEPTSLALMLARRDILKPYRGGTNTYRHSAFRPKGPARARYRLSAPLDGADSISLHTRGNLDADLYVYSGHRLVAKSAHSGHSELVRMYGCGWGRVTLEVRRRQGTGSFVLHTALP
jgi:hypothetical protein